MKTIFTITMVRNESARVVSWCDEYSAASDIVFENRQDISEGGYYPYCVIEQIFGNCVYPCPPKGEHWFAWHGGLGSYVQIAKPGKFEIACNFGIG